MRNALIRWWRLDPREATQGELQVELRTLLWPANDSSEVPRTSHGGFGPHPIQGSLPGNSVLIASAVFAQLTRVPNTQTTQHATSGPHLHTACRRCDPEIQEVFTVNSAMVREMQHDLPTT